MLWAELRVVLSAHQGLVWEWWPWREALGADAARVPWVACCVLPRKRRVTFLFQNLHF